MDDVSDSEKYPNDRALENVDGLEDDLDVPTYRKLAEPMNDDAQEDAQVAARDDEASADEAESVDDSDNTATQVFPGVPTPEHEPETLAPTPEVEAAVEDEPEPAPKPEPAPRKRYDAYAAAGRVKPQVIKPAAKQEPDPEPEPEPESEPEPEPALAPEPEAAATEVFHEPELDEQGEYVDPDRDFSEPTQVGAAAAATEVIERPDFAETTAEPTAAAPAEDDFYDDEEPEHRRGTTDFGLLLLRLGLGFLLLIHGLTTLLGWGGSGGTGALEAQFNSNNFALGAVMAVAIPTVQLIAATLLILGLAMPLGAGLALMLSAYLSMFEVATSAGGINIVGDGSSALQLQLLMTAMALGLQFTGPGQIGVDFSRGWARRPMASSWIFAVLAIAAAVALWWFTTSTLPFVS